MRVRCVLCPFLFFWFRTRLAYLVREEAAGIAGLCEEFRGFGHLSENVS